MKISTAFTTKYMSKCASCGELKLPGSAMLYVDDELIGESCCGDDLLREETDERSSMLFDSEPSNSQVRDMITLTMPRGRTAGDKCGRCFQVPSSNGTCGCD